MPGCLFLLCTQGECTVKIHVDQFKISKNSLMVIFPGVLFQIVKKTSNCRFMFLGFSSELLETSSLFSLSIEFTPYIFEKSILHLSPKAGKLLENYFMLFIRSNQIAPGMLNQEQATLAYTQLILGIGVLFKRKPDKPQRQKDLGIVKSIILIVINDYKKERGITYYADKVHLSTQYVSSTIKKITGRTLTDIISNMVIRDAKAKLRTTELSIQDISNSLNFPDISSFGKYFKRYTGMSATQYRNGDSNL